MEVGGRAWAGDVLKVSLPGIVGGQGEDQKKTLWIKSDVLMVCLPGRGQVHIQAQKKTKIIDILQSSAPLRGASF